MRSSALREMLRNPIYRGDLVWNRSEWVKDHETGWRRRFERPEAEWVRQHDESWRIVPESLWQQAQEVAAARAKGFERGDGGRITSHRTRAARPRHPLSGLLECGACSGSFFALRANEIYGCGWNRDRGSEVCATTLRVPRSALEDRIFAEARERISRETIELAVARALEVVRVALAEHDPVEDRARLAQIEVQTERLVDLVMRTGGVEAAERKIEELRAEKAAILTRLERAPAVPSEAALRAIAWEQARQ
ncbi:MAG TPA: recombinase family protein, partial [Candidatus Baltobacteraceae bacterium]|nr:recombinase family protein [Candidatus Baltobacteraceae bacterium]